MRAASLGKERIALFSDSVATIHLSGSQISDLIQKAARKLDAQGVQDISLEGTLWDLESIWSFIKVTES